MTGTVRLNRIGALSGGNDFFTVSYTFRLIHEHLRNAPELEPWVKRILIGSTNLAEARPRD